jgi:hypothetical protein
MDRRAFAIGGAAMIGDGLVRPVNAPPGQGRSLGIQPGVTGGVVVANKVIIAGPGGGLFVYSGTPKNGNLIYSISATADTDPYGNAYRSGATSYASSTTFVQVDTGSIQFQTPFGNALIDLTSGASGELQITGGFRPVLVNGTSFVAASGDTTGNTDSAAIAQALTTGQCTLANGATPYYVNGPVAMPSNAVLDGGGATIRPGSGYGSGVTGLLTLASSTVTGTLVRDLVLLDNYTVATINGVYYSTSTSVPDNQLRHVRAQGFLGSGFVLTATAGSASAHATNCVAYGNMGDGFQLTSDQLVTACEAGFNFGHGFHLLSGASNVYLANCLAWYSGVNPQTSIWPASGTSCGYFLEAPTQYSHLVGCHAQQNGLHGYALGATSGTAGFCYQLSIAGCGADTNSSYGAGGVGSGMFVSGIQESVITGFIGDNNGGLSPGSQLWGIQAPGGLVKVLFTGNSAKGTAGRSQIASRWTAMTMLNSWTNNAGFAVAQYSLTDSPPNTVEIIGAVAANAATAVTFAQLPAGFRPASVQGFALGSNGGGIAGSTPNLRCDTAGNLSVNNATVPSAATFIFHGFISLDA